MWRAAVRAGWPTATYRDPDHPLQQLIRATLEDYVSEPVPDPSVDGCGAPLFALSLLGLAKSFSQIAIAEASTPAGRVAASIRTPPFDATGTDDTLPTPAHANAGLLHEAGARGAHASARARMCRPTVRRRHCRG